jgi:hypothetical protein
VGDDEREHQEQEQAVDLGDRLGRLRLEEGEADPPADQVQEARDIESDGKVEEGPEKVEPVLVMEADG